MRKINKKSAKYFGGFFHGIVCKDVERYVSTNFTINPSPGTDTRMQQQEQTCS